MLFGFSFAKALEYLLDDKLRPPRLKILLISPVIGLFIWFVTIDKPSTLEEDALSARKFHNQAVVRRKYLNARGEPVLAIEQGTLSAQEIDWGRSFFSSELTNDSFPIRSRESYLRAEQYSLVAHALAGDSLIKLPNALSATLKRGHRKYVFYFHSLYP